MDIIIYKQNYSDEYVKKHTNYLFIFGDNEDGYGTGGQACIRYNSNAFGIPTKKHPDNNPESFYNDKEFERNRMVIKKTLHKFKKIMINYDKIIFPEHGIGTGLSQLPKKAPKTFAYLKYKIHKLFNKIRKGSYKEIKW